MSEKYFYTDGNEKYGPYSIEELRGKGIGRNTKVWREGLDTWVSADNLSELSELFNHIPPHIPTSSNSTQSNLSVPPKTWLVHSILVTLFCCLPFGIVGIVNASKVESRFYAGDHEGAIKASNSAKKWVNYSVIAGIIIFLFYFILGALGGLAEVLG